jgi:hypothetical protein
MSQFIMQAIIKIMYFSFCEHFHNQKDINLL